MGQIKFQFQSGAVKSCVSLLHSQCHRYFNSKVVRLKAMISIAKPLSVCYFNSKVVRLKEALGTAGESGKTYFNSKVVRLKVALFADASLSSRISIPKWCG